ncbi:MAG: hypothetical protein LBF55_03800 [Prevotellaceae bacterium]|nr:hypothetical protein [Prevotellaceae bacterium]
MIITQTSFAAQNSKTFWGEVTLGYGRSLGDYGKNYDILPGAANNMYTVSAKVKAGYYVLPQLSVGAGVGLSGYHNPIINTLPVFAEARYNVKRVPRLFSYLNAGASFGAGAFSSGAIVGAGLGYSIKTGRRTALNVSVGYDALLYKQTAVYLFTDEVAYSEMRHRHTMFLQLGFEF